MNRSFKTGIYILFLFTSCLMAHSVNASNDTIRVVSHSGSVIVTDPSKGFNNYPRWGLFPGRDVPIRKVTMYVHFSCPDTMRCADWDYSDHIRIGRVGGVNGDSLGWELGRIITPYGGFYGSDWRFTWQADVTDLSLVLRDSVEVIFIHSGYEPNHDRGWKLDLDFEIVTGTPVARPLSLTEIYNDNFEYGNDENPIDESLLPFTFTTAENAAFGRLRIIQTGHGMDRPDNCAEFCDKYREFRYDGKLIQKRQMWMKCGDNPVFPQAGTWIFDRANWCPGYLMQAETFDLPVIPGSDHTIRLVMEPYTATLINHGAQVISAYLIQYGEPLHSTDVAVEDIIIPSGKDIHARKNPSGANAQITVRNLGMDDVETMAISYGTEGFPQKTLFWSGSLSFNQTETISLPGIIESRSGENLFSVTLENPNGKPDQYPGDNSMSSRFLPAPVHGTGLVFYLLTNRQPEHNSWQLLNCSGELVKERLPGSLEAETAYTDTLKLDKGAYSLVLTDTGGDGLEFWFNASGGRGEARLLDADNNLIKAFESDCGSGWTYNFVVGDNPDPIDPAARSISVYPARTSEATTLTYFANTPSDVVVKLVTDPGDVIVEERKYTDLREGTFTFDLSRFDYGRFYLRVYAGGDEVYNRRVRYTEPVTGHDEPPYMAPADKDVAQKLEQWQDWKFGVIIHWGPYSQWGIVESWSLCPEDEPWCERRGPYADDYHTYVREYEKIRQLFNPVKFNPAGWAEACRHAGMKYVVFTTKHHDGFCMYDSKYTDYKISDPESRFSAHPGSNIAKEVFDAFRKEGMGIGAYFSKPDWNNDDYWWPYFPVFDRNVNYDPEKYPERWDRFREFTFNQIEELMTAYGSIDILWLDGGWVRPAGSLTEESRPWLGKNQWVQDIDMPSIATMAREHQPGLLIVDRSVHGEFENYRTPEQHVPAGTLPYPWESCITLGDSWYSTGPGENYKSVHWAIHTLVNIVAKGGNMLMGIGPDKTGELSPEVYERLEEIGNWMTVNGEAIYNTRPLEPYSDGNCCFTRSNDETTRYMFFLLDEGEPIPGKISIPDEFARQAMKAGLLGHPSALGIRGTPGNYTIDIPRAFRKTFEGSPAIVLYVDAAAEI